MAMLKRCGIIVAAVSAVYASGVVASSPSLSYSVSWNSSPFPSASVRLLSSDRLMTETWAAGQGLLRSTRAVYTFAVNTIDYKVSLMRYDPNSEEYYNTRDQVHMRTAKRILKLCETNRGFYIKAGQFIASMQHVPKEFVQTLSVLQDKASFWPFKLMEQVFQEEFGKSAEEIYGKFDETPIAAASLAQVHHAFLKDGQEVAVKVQYPGLQRQFETDIATMAFLSKAIAWLFPDYQFEWMVPEFEKNLLRELDFLQEANNAERTAKSFAHKEGILVPRVVKDLTTKRILTMEFMEGCKIDDVQALEKAGIDPAQVAQELVEIFAEMVFCHGYVHGDPHPGNILVHKHPGRKSPNFDIVLLDHGLYRDFDESFRLSYCRLWRAIVLLDSDELQEAGRQLGAGEFTRYLPIIFTGRGMGSKSELGQAMSAEEQKVLKEEVRRFTMADISNWMEGLPREFLTILRTDGLLRSISNKLGASRRSRLIAYVKYAVAGLAIGVRGEPSLQAQGWLVYTRAQLDYIYLRLRLEVFDLVYKASLLYGALLYHWNSLSTQIQQVVKIEVLIQVPLLTV
ncbi:hypothetical protein BDL97_19G074400 [Sphagnum fallax]|nr:hypothetical protein BDL97_19G074400 [Sphagnum fallax]